MHARTMGFSFDLPEGGIYQWISAHTRYGRNNPRQRRHDRGQQRHDEPAVYCDVTEDLMNRFAEQIF